jgi:hypothetical protein
MRVPVTLTSSKGASEALVAVVASADAAAGPSAPSAPDALAGNAKLKLSAEAPAMAALIVPDTTQRTFFTSPPVMPLEKFSASRRAVLELFE